MDEKLKELTDIIVKEGVDKANVEAGQINDQAKNDANDILHRARKEAEDTVALAQKQADEIRKNTESELKLSSQQIISNLKQKITDLLLIKMLEGPLSDSFKKPAFVGGLITDIVKNWNPQDSNAPQLKALLPEVTYSEVEKFLKDKSADILADGLKIEVDKKLASGFQVTPESGGFKLNFSDAEFMEFFKTFLRARTQELLFGDA